jgi:ABC-2 type transport system permease protein
MNAMLQLIRTDLRLYFANRRAVIMSIVAPILIATFFGYLFSDRGGGTSRMPVAVVDLDNSELSKKLIAAFQGEKLLEIQVLDEPQAVALTKSGKVRAAVVIPAKFGAQAGMALFTAQDRPELTLHYDPSQTAALQAVRGVIAQNVMQTVSADAFSTASSTFDNLRANVSADSQLPEVWRKDLGTMFDSIDRVRQHSDADNSAIPGEAQRTGPSLGLPYTLKEVAAVSRADVPYNSYAHSFAGMSVQFILMMGVDVGIALLAMRRMGLWQRLRAAPLSKSTLLGSRIVGCAVIALIVLAAIYTFAMLVFKVRIEGSLIGFLGVSLAFAVLTASFGLLIASLGKTPEATRGLAIVVTLLLVMLGGAWIPSFFFPEWMQQITRFVPTRWAVDGLDAMTWRAQPLSVALKPIALMLGTSVLFGLIAVRKFSWEE